MPIVWALLAHVVLMGALTWGVSWRKDATPASFEVEVWSPEAMRAAEVVVRGEPARDHLRAPFRLNRFAHG